ncbi:MAG: hypothetical protein JWP35_3388 [Caulobacter sp.]|nr:hypothetical protein [Caulobacter sp.]
MRIVSLGLAAAVAALSLSSPSQAMAYKDGKCAVTVPDGWVISKSRAARPDKKIWVSMMDAPTSAEIVNVELGLKAVKVSEDGRFIVLVSTASYGGLTNKQYHVVSKTSPSCVADVTAPAGADEALARQIGMTLSVVH